MLTFCFYLVLGMGPSADVAIPSYISTAVTAPDRPDKDRARDERRKPADVLAFFQIRPGHKVADLMAGSGYYSHILSRVVGPGGAVYAQNTQTVIDNLVKDRLKRRLENPALSNVKAIVAPLEDPQLPDGLDAVLMILFYHDTFWQGVDRAQMNAAIFKALKPGGIYGIVDHRAGPGRGSKDTESLHRVEEELVVQDILAAGFILDAESDHLAHPDDSYDYPFFKDFPKHRDQTDRFILRFRKPAN